MTVLALITKKPVRYALTREEEFLTITKHKVVTKIKTAIKDGAITRAQVRSLLGHRRLCGNRPAHRPQVGLHVGGAVSHSQRVDRFLLRVHEQSAGGRVSRLRRAAGDLGLRLADGHDRARHRRGSGGVSFEAGIG